MDVQALLSVLRLGGPCSRRVLSQRLGVRHDGRPFQRAVTEALARGTVRAVGAGRYARLEAVAVKAEVVGTAPPAFTGFVRLGEGLTSWPVRSNSDGLVEYQVAEDRWIPLPEAFRSDVRWDGPGMLYGVSR